MELYLQIGWGMMDHCYHLTQAWGTSTAIMSPRDQNDSQLHTFSSRMRTLGGKVLLDPQFYLPHADHERLCAHSYWPQDYETSSFWSGAGLSRLLQPLFDLNVQLGCDAIILPGLHAERIDSDWLDRQILTIRSATQLNTSSYPLLATIALSEKAVSEAEDIHTLLDSVNSWDVDGVYLVCEHPSGDYLVRDPIWLANLVDLVAGCRLKDKRVILGYSQHQMLITACVSGTAIASGTYMNVRSFPPEKFRQQYDDDIKQRATWYYCPQALSEFNIPTLDVAQRLGVLVDLVTPSSFGSTYADPLFNGSKPSASPFTEREAFRHYLQCLRTQTVHLRKATFDDTVRAYQGLLDEAEMLLDALHHGGINGRLRDFEPILQATRQALVVLQNERGPMLRRNWTLLGP